MKGTRLAVRIAALVAVALLVGTENRAVAQIDIIDSPGLNDDPYGFGNTLTVRGAAESDLTYVLIQVFFRIPGDPGDPPSYHQIGPAYSAYAQQSSGSEILWQQDVLLERHNLDAGPGTGSYVVRVRFYTSYSAYQNDPNGYRNQDIRSFPVDY